MIKDLLVIGLVSCAFSFVAIHAICCTNCNDLNIYPELRLVGSPNGNPNEGFVLIKTHNGSWGSVSIRHFGENATAVAKVVCRNLGFE